MAQPDIPIDQINSQQSSIRDQISSIQSGTQPGAYGGSSTPSYGDMASQAQLQKLQAQLQTLEDNKRRQQWYGPKSNTQAQSIDTGDQSSSGLIGKFTNVLQGPLRSVVGAVQHVTGQGTTGTLLGDIQDNLARRKETFGDVLKNTGLPYAVAAPAGFALDIAADPVNWFTMGESAIIPRIASGITKGAAKAGVEGAVEGAGLAVKSKGLTTAATIGKYIPGMKKTETFQNLAKSALESTSNYEKLTGRTAEAIVRERGFGVGTYRVALNDLVQRVAETVPGGKAILENFKYDPGGWVDEARVKDILEKSLGTGADLRGAVNARASGKDITPFLGKIGEGAEASTGLTGQVEQLIEKAPVASARINFDMPETPALRQAAFDAVDKLSGTELGDRLSGIAPKMVSSVDDAASLLQNPKLGFTVDPIENALRIANEALPGSGITMKDLESLVNSGALGETGWKWYDDVKNSVRNFKITVGKNQKQVYNVGKRVLDSYDTAMGIFRPAKTALSPATYTNQIVGNMIMLHLAGADITDPGLFTRLRQTKRLFGDKGDMAAFFDDLMMNADLEADSIRRGLLDNPTAVRGTFGVSGNALVGARYNAERVVAAARDAGILPKGVEAGEIAKPLSEALDELRSVAASNPEAVKYTDALPKGVQAGTKAAMEALSKGVDKASKLDVGTGLLENELLTHNAAHQMFSYIAKKAQSEPDNMAWKVLDGLFNKASSKYATIDQVFKFTSFIRSTVDGYTIDELRKLRHYVNINPEDLTKIATDGTWRYRIAPIKALELSNVMYMNYNAMPAAVKVLRDLPLLGSPFISFAYAMALKTGQTMAYNPAAFNKISFAINDFGGQKTPLEKNAINTSPYYSYLSQSGNFRIPFFDQSPLYVDLTRMLPYYSMNIFQENNAQYADVGAGGDFINMVQSSPFMKDPVGQTLFNYLIQPLILRDAAMPKGSFGEPLYPYGATASQKVGYGARSLTEAFVPNVFGYAGLVTPEAAADYIPSYRWRQLAYAKSGKNQFGISGKESPASRTLRSVLSATGVPVQAPVNLTFQANSTKNNQ